MKLSQLVYLCVYFISFSQCFAQTNIDSLKQELYSGTDTNRLEIFYTLFWDALYKDPLAAESMADSVYALAEEMDYQTGRGMAHDAYMNIAILQSEYEQAIFHIQAKRLINIEIENPLTWSAYHQSMGQIYYMQAEFDSSAFHFKRASHVYLDLGYFDYHSNMLVNTGSIYQQIGRLYGGEFGLDFHPHIWHDLHLKSTIAFVHGTNVALNEPLPLMLPLNWTNELGVQLDSWRGIKGLFLKLEHQYFAAQDRVSSDELESDSYGIMNLGFGARLHGVQIGLFGRNLLNKAYIPHLSMLRAQGITNPGRNIALKLSYQL